MPLNRPLTSNSRPPASRNHAQAGNQNDSQANAPINDRAAPRWQVSSIACAVLSGGEWHPAALLNISLGGAKVRGKWDKSLPVTAVSLTDDGPAADDTLLILEAEAVWVDPARAMAALRFDVPDRRVAANLLKFLSRHIASSSSLCR